MLVKSNIMALHNPHLLDGQTTAYTSAYSLLLSLRELFDLAEIPAKSNSLASLIQTLTKDKPPTLLILKAYEHKGALLRIYSCPRFSLRKIEIS